jgi:exodeoxyribonuclease VII small subunit
MGKKNQSAPKSFEEAIAELEKILSELESGQVGLEESLTRYERGTFLIQHCRGVLGAAEKQIELLSKADDGSIQSQPMSEQDEEE